MPAVSNRNQRHEVSPTTQGYFSPEDLEGAAGFYPGAPTRLFDTRNQTGAASCVSVNCDRLLTQNSDGERTYLIYGPGGHPYAQITGTDIVYYHRDQIGSTRLLTDASGDPVGTYTYDPHGALTGSTGTVAPLLGYAGEYTDHETGYTYLRARHYDPTTGQFLTRDPLEQQTWEPYAYAANNPVTNVDPTGLCNLGPVRIGFLSNDDGSCRGAGVAQAAWDHKAEIAGVVAVGTCVVATAGACTTVGVVAAGVGVAHSAEANLIRPEKPNWAAFAGDVVIETTFSLVPANEAAMAAGCWAWREAGQSAVAGARRRAYEGVRRQTSFYLHSALFGVQQGVSFGLDTALAYEC